MTGAGLAGVLEDLIGPDDGRGNGNGLFQHLTNKNYASFMNQAKGKCCTDETGGNGNSGGNGLLFTRAEATLLIELATQLLEA